MIRRIFTVLSLSIACMSQPGYSQISPGDLAEAHAHLEGMSNCTQCHILGDKVSNDKCLKCHAELRARIDLSKGYHASDDVRSKECVICHNDHHGRNFQIVRFSESTFNHRLTGYELLGTHAQKDCKACHKPEFIQNPNVKSKKYTYLGLDPACLSCHEDYHQNTLSSNCLECHNFNKFSPAGQFDHNRSDFPLAGKHASVECGKCHKIVNRNGKEYQEFKGISFSNCTSCHADAHKNQFGQDCRRCHTEESFHIIRGIDHFDHNLTAFKLEGKHQAVNCRSCHKTNLTDPLKYGNCSDCHQDYHNDQFLKNGIKPDCSACHTTAGFSEFNYSVELHNTGIFKLDGAHLATPCFDCHKKGEKWNFRDIGLRCSDCHLDIHRGFLDPKYYPETNCSVCHLTVSWNETHFDHSKTGFILSGAHASQSCRSCHFNKDKTGTNHQQFSGLAGTCITCHADVHYGQFKNKGIEDCRSCHDDSNWKALHFDHSKTRFRLDGKHANVPCYKCHKEVITENSRYIQYTYIDFKCETCHH